MKKVEYYIYILEKVLDYIKNPNSEKKGLCIKIHDIIKEDLEVAENIEDNYDADLVYNILNAEQYIINILKDKSKELNVYCNDNFWIYPSTEEFDYSNKRWYQHRIRVVEETLKHLINTL